MFWIDSTDPGSFGICSEAGSTQEVEVKFQSTQEGLKRSLNPS